MYSMSLRIKGAERRIRYELDIARQVAFASYISGNLNPKGMHRTVDAFWPVGGDKKQKKLEISDEVRNALAEAIRKQKETHGDKVTD